MNDVIMICTAGNDGNYGIDYPAAYSEAIALEAVTSTPESSTLTRETLTVTCLGPPWLRPTSRASYADSLSGHHQVENLTTCGDEPS